MAGDPQSRQLIDSPAVWDENGRSSTICLFSVDGSVRGQVAELMNVRFYIDPDTAAPHIYAHNVVEAEVYEVLQKPMEEVRGRGNSVIAHGQTRSGRYLKVVYVPDDDGNAVFVITAYTLTSRQQRALLRRKRRRQ